MRENYLELSAKELEEIEERRKINRIKKQKSKERKILLRSGNPSTRALANTKG